MSSIRMRDRDRRSPAGRRSRSRRRHRASAARIRDEGAGRGRPLAAYRPSGARRARPGHRRPSARVVGRPADAAERRQRLRRRRRGRRDGADSCEPQMNGIGGNGFMTLFDKKTGKVHVAGDGRRGAEGLKPAEMTPETLNAGIKAGIVPGNLGGYLDAARALRHDEPRRRASRRRSSTPRRAIRSIRCSRRRSRARKSNLSKYPTTAKIFLPGGEPLDGRRAAEESRLRRHAAKLVEAEQQAQSRRRRRDARRSRPRSIASTRATSRRSSIASSRRTAA